MSCDSGGNGGTEPPPTPSIVRVQVSPAADTLELGSQRQFNAVALDVNGFPVEAAISWSSSSPEIAEVTQTGLVTARRVGNASISASADGKTGLAAVRVVDSNPPAGPTGLSATPASDVAVDLSWVDASDNEERFQIQRREVGEDPDFVDLADVPADRTDFRDRRLTERTEYQYRIQACNSFGCSGYGPEVSTTTDAELVLLTDSVPDGLVGDLYDEQLEAEGGNGEFDWSLVSGELPEGLVLEGSGRLTGTPQDSGTYAITVAVMSNEQTDQGPLEFFIEGQVTTPVIVTDTLPVGREGVEYEAALEATGGDGEFSWSIVSGGLPGGIQLSAAGELSGTPTAAGVSVFEVLVSSGGLNSRKELEIEIVWDTLSLETSLLPSAAVDQPYSAFLEARGGDGEYAWDITVGDLPEGLTLDGETGEVSGTPTVLGTSSFTVAVSSGDGQTDSGVVDLAVVPGTVTITTDSIPDARLLEAYTFTLEAEGGDGTFAWSVFGGKVPPGLSLDPETGTLSGTPTEAGAFPLDIRATSGSGAQRQSDEASFTIRVQDDLVVVTTVLAPGLRLTPYADTLEAEGGDEEYTWKRVAGALPAGITLSSGGVLSGTPTAEGDFGFTVEVASGGQTARRDLGIQVTAVTDPPVITTSSLPEGMVGQPYADTLEATGGSGFYQWSTATALPTGLVLDTDGVLQGVPEVADTLNLEITVNSGGLSASRTLTLRLQWDTLSITTTELPGIPFQNEWADTLRAAGGDGDYTWSVTAGELPDGLELVDSTGVLTGYPTELGTRAITVEVESGDGQVASRDYTAEVVPGPVNILNDSIAEGKPGLPYLDTLRAEGGNGIFVWGLGVGSAPLPAGITLNPTTGVLSGTPAESGLNLTVFAARAQGTDPPIVGEKSLPLLVQFPLVLGPDTLPNAVRGLPYLGQLEAEGGARGYTYTIEEGALPDGLALDLLTGIVSGVPADTGLFEVTYRVTTRDGEKATAEIPLTVYEPLVVGAGELPSGTVGVAYAETPTVTGGDGTYTWSLTAGALPTGLSLNEKTGEISGTPVAEGTFAFNLTVESGDGQVTGEPFSIQVQDP